MLGIKTEQGSIGSQALVIAVIQQVVDWSQISAPGLYARGTLESVKLSLCTNVSAEIEELKDWLKSMK